MIGFLKSWNFVLLADLFDLDYLTQKRENPLREGLEENNSDPLLG